MNKIGWTFHDARRIAELVLDGTVTAAGLQAAFQRLEKSPKWDKDWQIMLVAGPGARLEELTLPALRLHQSFILGWNLRHRRMRGARTAFVSNDALKLAIARLWETVSRLESAVNVAAFDDRDAAMDWLRPGVDDRPRLDVIPGGRGEEMRVGQV
ncbi:hypothetical protein [Maricaulis sp. CAU 1757]